LIKGRHGGGVKFLAQLKTARRTTCEALSVVVDQTPRLGFIVAYFEGVDNLADVVDFNLPAAFDEVKGLQGNAGQIGQLGDADQAGFADFLEYFAVDFHGLSFAARAASFGPRPEGVTNSARFKTRAKAAGGGLRVSNFWRGSWPRQGQLEVVSVFVDQAPRSGFVDAQLEALKHLADVFDFYLFAALDQVEGLRRHGRPISQLGDADQTIFADFLEDLTVDFHKFLLSRAVMAALGGMWRHDCANGGLSRFCLEAI
jgi:hypothetical protein